MRAKCFRCGATRELATYKILEARRPEAVMLCASCWRLDGHGFVNPVTLIPVVRQYPETQNAALDVGRRPA